MTRPPHASRGSSDDPVLPELESGDELSRDEFERRYAAMRCLKKAELIEGVVCVPSPVRFEQHGERHAELVTWFGTYRTFTPRVRVGDNSTLRLDLDNEPQPDVVMIVDASCGGQARIDRDGYISGAPELAAEVAASTASLDLNAKLKVYHRSGVREYLVWRVLERAIDWFILRQSEYHRLPVGRDGVCRSETFPGLWLDMEALTSGDVLRVHTVLMAGVAAAEHGEFVERIRRRAAPAPSASGP